MFYFFVLRHYFPFQCFYGPSINSTSSTHEGSFHCTTFYGPHFELGFHPLNVFFCSTITIFLTLKVPLNLKRKTDLNNKIKQ